MCPVDCFLGETECDHCRAMVPVYVLAHEFLLLEHRGGRARAVGDCPICRGRWAYWVARAKTDRWDLVLDGERTG